MARINNKPVDPKQVGLTHQEKNEVSVRASEHARRHTVDDGTIHTEVSNSKTPQQNVEENNGGSREVDDSGMQASRKDTVLGLLDPINKRIVGMLEQNVFVSQTEIAKELGLSQSSVALRLLRLRKSGILIDNVGLNLKVVGLEMCRVDADCSDPRSILEWAKSCPLFLNGCLGVGSQNVSLYFTAEDTEMFQFIIDQHIRHLEGVNLVQFSPIVSWGKDLIVPLKLDVQRSESPPCGFSPYCPRCPANPAYDGKVWNSDR
jgi:DNA-binding Lrp family transcriptional regulator